MDLHISLPAENLFSIGSFVFTNAMASGVLTILLAIAAVVLLPRSFSVIPGKIQIVLEMLMEYVMNQLESAFGSKSEAKKFFPLLFTLLLFLVIANQLTVVPLIGQITLGEKSLFRLTTADLNATFALAILIIGISHVIALRASPLRHIESFFRFRELFAARSMGQFASASLSFALGLLDIVGEFAKVLSLSFRIFGNIFAGEVMIAVIASISVYTQYFVPIPFIFLSVFSGFVQAFVFFMLSMQFIAATIRSQHNPEDSAEPELLASGNDQLDPVVALRVPPKR